MEKHELKYRIGDKVLVDSVVTITKKIQQIGVISDKDLIRGVYYVKFEDGSWTQVAEWEIKPGDE